MGMRPLHSLNFRIFSALKPLSSYVGMVPLRARRYNALALGVKCSPLNPDANATGVAHGTRIMGTQSLVMLPEYGRRLLFVLPVCLMT